MAQFGKLTEAQLAPRWWVRPCNNCGEPYLGYLLASIRCDECKAALTKTPAAIQAQAARYAVKTAIRRGELTRQPCEKCGHVHPHRRSHAHHEDYSRPLDVVWLCSMHHKQRHAEINAANLIAL